MRRIFLKEATINDRVAMMRNHRPSLHFDALYESSMPFSIIYDLIPMRIILKTQIPPSVTCRLLFPSPWHRILAEIIDLWNVWSPVAFLRFSGRNPLNETFQNEHYEWRTFSECWWGWLALGAVYSKMNLRCLFQETLLTARYSSTVV